MRIPASFPSNVKTVEHFWITLKDGCRLAARMWLPADAEAKPVPAVLEYIPYRKRDGTRGRDEPMHGYFAGHGYAAIRVDMRGSGESDGVLQDEYSQLELDDAVEVIDWIARQPWCDGKVGMMGKSLGRLQLPAGRRDAAEGAEGGALGLLDRRPLCRRHPLHGRLPAQRQSLVGRHHARLSGAPGGSGAVRRGMARQLAEAPRARCRSGPRSG